MDIVIVGTGNAAQVLGKVMLRAGHTILQVYGRTETAARQCADLLNAQPVTDLAAITPEAHYCLLAISDGALEVVAAQLHLPETIVLHTSGGVSIHVLSGHNRYGVLYPLQSLRKELPYLPQIPFFIDGSDATVKAAIADFAKTLSPQVYMAGDEERLKLHIAAVLCSNFSNHLFALTQQFCEKENIAFNVLLPLMEETVQRMKFSPPGQLQTGPAIRKDETTIQKHLEVLRVYPAIAQLYEVLTKSIQQTTL